MLSASDLVEVRYVADLFRYLAARLRVASQQATAPDAAAAAAGHDALGTLIPLHCGHNAAYSDEEREMLTFHVEKAIRTWRE